MPNIYVAARRASGFPDPRSSILSPELVFQSWMLSVDCWAWVGSPHLSVSADVQLLLEADCSVLLFLQLTLKVEYFWFPDDRAELAAA